MSKALNSLSTRRLSILVCMSFALRLFLLDTQSVWWDEAVSLHLATSSLADLLADRAAHVHPPLYFLLLKGWIALGGTSAFSARFFSAWFNTLLVPAAYTFGRRWLDRRTGLLAGILVTISPLYVIYSQEARVYALLPLGYLAILALVNRLTRLEPPATWREWLLLAGVETAGLYLHYVFLVTIAYVNLLLLLQLWRRRRQRVRWLVSLAIVVLLCLPWAITVFLNREAVQADIGAGDPFVKPIPSGFFVRLLWTFQWSGLTAAPGYPPLQVPTLVLTSLLLMALAFLLIDAQTRTTTLRLLAHWLVPLSGAVLMWQAKPLSHPRYIALFAVALLILAGYGLAQLGRHRAAVRMLAVLLGLTIFATSSLALHAWYFVPRFAKDDVRGLAAWLGTETTADDLIVAPSQDWSLDYAYHGQAPIIRPDPTDEGATWDTFVTHTTSARRIFLVGYPRAGQDRRGLVPFMLESAGSLIERHSFKGLLVRVYALDGPVNPLLQLSTTNADFGPLSLTAAWLEPSPAADTALTLALRWRLEERVGDRYRVGLRLRDLDGWELSAADVWLLDDRALPTDRWSAGEESTTYHVLPLAPGIPPLTYTLSIGIYTTDDNEAVHPLDLLDDAGNPQGQSHEVGIVKLAPAGGLYSDPHGVAYDLPSLPKPAALANGLLLEAAAVDRQTVAPGQSLFVTLRWRATADSLPDLRPMLTVSQAGNILVTTEDAPAGGRYPTNRWQAGEVVLEHRRLTIPPTATDGSAAVILRVGERGLELGQVEIATGERIFAPPPMAHEVHARFGDGSGESGRAVAELLGYDLASGPYTSGQSILITLYWHALERAASADYTIFTHILAADGHLVGQHDGPPAGGTRPTPGWIPGEVIADWHEMTFREAYTGPARVEVGLYDPVTGKRVPAEGGETFVLLPTMLTILEH